MDYLDPRKEQQHRIILFVGYACIAVAIFFSTWLLVYLARGYGVQANGTVIQNGLLYVSSQPNPAKITLNGKLYKNPTNTRQLLPENTYKLELSRDGYRGWQRTFNLEGGRVLRIDYPFLFPTDLKTTSLTDYQTAPGVATQSPDRRWLLVQLPGSATAFQVYDLKSKQKVVSQINVPANILSKAAATESWQIGEWSDDNRHVVLRHIYDGNVEFILIDRVDPEQSINLNTKLASSPSELQLKDKKYDQYYLYFAANGNVQTASLDQPKPTPLIGPVLVYKSYGSKSMLFITAEGAPSGKVLLKFMDGDRTYSLRSFPAGSQYLIDLAEYDGTMYVIAGASAENKAYIYRDPLGQLDARPEQALLPTQILRVNQPNYVSFSATAQFVMIENGQQFALYDIFNKASYRYATQTPLDKPQLHAAWMDGDRLSYVTGGQLTVFDYDGNNQQLLMPAHPDYGAFFAPNYRYVYSFGLPLNGAVKFTQTSLRTPADQ